MTAAVAALVGCGSSNRLQSAPGAALFAARCSGCHTLAGGDAKKTSGGDLVEFHFPRAVLTQYTSEMPLTKPLTATEMRAVVDYVLAVQSRPGGRG